MENPENQIEELLKEVWRENGLILCVMSSPLQSQKIQKINIRPVLIKNEKHYQVTELKGEQAFHLNLSKSECEKYCREQLIKFKQAFIFTSTADYQILISKKEQITILKKPPSKNPLALAHNRKKEYLLEENTPVPFLVELGVMNRDGKVQANKRDKFKQINRFLEMVDDVIPNLNQNKVIHIVDFGCGKSYLTFALYHYLKIQKGFQIKITGLDLKEDVITKCQNLAKKLRYEDLTFLKGDINQYHQEGEVDMVVSLHACDTATDAALEKAVRWNADVILCVPCCQHELFNQVKNESLDPLLKHGIFKERFAALATDAARAQLLEVLGYKVQVLEFIDMEHTPKNLLIRAVKSAKKNDPVDAWNSYLEFKKSLKISPFLEKRFIKELEKNELGKKDI